MEKGRLWVMDEKEMGKEDKRERRKGKHDVKREKIRCYNVRDKC